MSSLSINLVSDISPIPAFKQRQVYLFIICNRNKRANFFLKKMQ